MGCGYERGLPLMGFRRLLERCSMDKVGTDGKGESIWVGIFPLTISSSKFAHIATFYNDSGFADVCTTEAARLQANIEQHGWDGDWYRRAYFDNGTPLGASGNAECRIDSISQSWSVLSGAGSKERSRKGMESVDKYLVRRDNGSILPACIRHSISLT